jgi:hypothetical protein
VPVALTVRVRQAGPRAWPMRSGWLVWLVSAEVPIRGCVGEDLVHTGAQQVFTDAVRGAGPGRRRATMSETSVRLICGNAASRPGCWHVPLPDGVPADARCPARPFCCAPSPSRHLRFTPAVNPRRRALDSGPYSPYPFQPLARALALTTPAPRLGAEPKPVTHRIAATLRSHPVGPN